MPDNAAKTRASSSRQLRLAEEVCELLRAMRAYLSVFVVFVALWLCPSLLQAASLYSPNVHYRTVESPRFAVHYPQGSKNLAVRVARLAEEILAADAALLDFVPKGTIDIVLTDTQDDANGSAEVLPHNCLRLLLAAPTELTGLASYDDWLRILLTHELAHIVDIDHTRGITAVLRKVFGKTIALNGSVPQYLSEGIAVWTETKLTPCGRGRSSYVDMVLRMAALKGTFVGIDQAHIQFAHFPFGNAAYFYGGRFHLYLSQRLGDAAVARLHAFYAAQPLPWLYYFGASRVFGKSIESLWRDFAASETAFAKEVAASVTAAGITPSTELFSHAGDLLGARYSKRGDSVLFTQVSPEDGSTVRRLTLAANGRKARNKRLFRDTASPRFTLDVGHGDDFVYSMASITHRFDSYGDLYVYDAQRKTRTKFFDANAPKQSLRARDPSLSPDGRRLVFVQTKLHQSWLATADVTRRQDGRLSPALRVRPLVMPSGDMQQASPAFHPNGDLLAVSTWFPGGHRDIVLLDSRSGKLVRRLTNDEAQDGNPTFSPDGRYVLYESDQDGISNIYAYELASGRYSRVTRVIGGAFQADVAPSGDNMLFRQAIGGGFAVHEMPYAPASWQPLTYDPAEGYRPAAAATEAEASVAPTNGPSAAWMTAPWPEGLPRSEEPPLALAAGEREGPYHPLRGLLPTRDNWLLLPAVFFYNNNFGLSLTTYAQDSLRRHAWSLSAGGLLHVNRPNLTLSYSNDVLLPTLSGSIGYNSTLYSTSLGRLIESSASGAVRATLILGRRHQLSAGYAFEHRQLQGAASASFPRGRFASVGVSYRYGFARSFPYSISQETGRAFGIGVQSYGPWVGSERRQVVVSGEARVFLNNPLVVNHVLALRLAANWAVGPDSVQKFFLYGTQANSFFTAQSSRLYALRGFWPGRGLGAPAPGDGLMALYGEYRLPLWHIQRGLLSWPIFFEHLHAAVFADSGNTMALSANTRAAAIDRTATDFFKHLWVSAGAEVRLDMSLSWAVPLTVRLGIAEPLVARGVRVIERARPLFYVNVGNLF